ncbi:MAG: hypothetical protein Q8K92_19870 [Leadbetterella sp.]|nr:hypothetical protein [Leadbetterella sp.]
MSAVKNKYHDIIVAGQEGRILSLVVSHKWFEMYASGEKKEDYREITGYWCKRLLKPHHTDEYIPNDWKDFEYVQIFKGYSSKKLVYEMKGISTKKPNPTWSPSEFHNKILFAIEIGEQVYSNLNEGK